MKIAKRIEQMWEQDRKYTTRYMLVFSGTCFVHAMLLFLFVMAGQPLLAALNGATLVGYCVWLVLFTKRRVNDWMLLFFYLDVLIHAGIYNILLGIGYAFYLYPIVFIPVTFFLSVRDLNHGNTIVNSFIMSVLAIIVMLITLVHPPIVLLENTALQSQFFQINLLMCALLLCVYTSEFMSETLNTRERLSFHAENDPLTGIRNRYGFLKEAKHLQGSQYCVVMCDIDNFKQFNDLYGHASGDVILSKIGRLLQSSIRRGDSVCRWGGEEFILILRCDLNTAHALTEEIRRKLDTVTINANDTTLSVTMTFGIADCMEASSLEQLQAIADRNLLRGKRSGKNCVVLSSDEREITGEIHTTQQALDTSFLTDRTFSAFSATSDTTYIYICNLSTNVSRWSRTAVDYFGLPSEFMYDAGNIWLGFVHPDDRDAYAADVDAVLSGRKRFHDVTYRARNKEGEYVRLVCKGVVTEADAEHPAVFAGTITNLGTADGLTR